MFIRAISVFKTVGTLASNGAKDHARWIEKNPKTPLTTCSGRLFISIYI